MTGSTVDRRQFLGTAAATAAAFLATHDALLAGGQQAVSTGPQEPAGPRLLSLELLTGAPIEEMKRFYGRTLDLRLLDERPDRFSVEAGETRLTFVSATATVDGRAPFYHFAFNIPENKIVQALEWQKARTPLLAIPDANRAHGYPPEVVDYRHWNAHSIFFLDPAGNVVEYIARHDLRNGDSRPFGWSDLLYLSEIGLVIDDVPAAAEAVKKAAAVPQYRGGDSRFMAMGDEHGLLLLMQRGRVIDFTGNPANGVRIYPTVVNVRGATAATHQLAGHPHRITIEERCSCA